MLSAGVSELHAGLCPDTFLDLDNAAAFECFKQNPAVIQLVSEGQMATALRAAASAGDVLLLLFLQYLDPTVVDAAGSNALLSAVQAIQEVTDIYDCWAELNVIQIGQLAAAKMLMLCGAALPVMCKPELTGAACLEYRHLVRISCHMGRYHVSNFACCPFTKLCTDHIVHYVCHAHLFCFLHM